jgi:hypothetical protein
MGSIFQYSVTIHIDSIQMTLNSIVETEYHNYLAIISWCVVRLRYLQPWLELTLRVDYSSECLLKGMAKYG